MTMKKKHIKSKLLIVCMAVVLVATLVQLLHKKPDTHLEIALDYEGFRTVACRH